LPGLVSSLFAPIPADIIPPGVNDAGAIGTTQDMYALANHTHPSQVRKARLQTDSSGVVTWIYTDKNGDPMPFSAGVVPRICALAETGVGINDVYNAQIEGVPTNTQVKIRVAVAQRSVAALLGLTVLSIPASVGVTWVHLVALAP